MFCYQRSFGLPTEAVTKEQFRALIAAPETFRKVKEAREALAKGDKTTYDNRKKSLPFVIFIATYDESDKVFENKQTGKKTTKRGTWRNQKHCRLNGLCVIDFDHVDEVNDNDNDNPNLNLNPNDNPNSKRSLRDIWDEAYARLSEEDKKRILFVGIPDMAYIRPLLISRSANLGSPTLMASPII